MNPITVDTMYISSDNELLREFVYKIYLQKNDLQESYFRSILSKRFEIHFILLNDFFTNWILFSKGKNWQICVISKPILIVPI